MNIGISIYDNGEVLDFAGPFEVFSSAKRLSDADWQILLVPKDDRLVTLSRQASTWVCFSLQNYSRLHWWKKPPDRWNTAGSVTM